MARIALDVQTLQTPERDRGIGRFVAGQVRGLLERADSSGHTYLLVGNARLPPPTGFEKVTALLPLADPGSLPRAGSGEVLAAWASEARIDLFYASSPLAYDVAVPEPTDALPLVGMVHDLIPLLFEDQAFSGTPGPVRNDYFRRLGFLSRCRHLMTYSESNRRDLDRELGVPGDRVTVVGAAAEPCFEPGSEVGDLAVVREKYGVRGRLVLSVTGFNFRKNITGTIAAFARLPEDLLRNSQLLLACGFGSEAEREAVERLASEHGVADRVLLPGHVREDLPRLYQAADAFFLPTFYEGFGIPVLEAMACGTPVVASSVSSIPEVVGDAGILVDPRDPSEGAEALRRVLDNRELAADLREQGRRRAEEFSWAEAVRKTLAGFERALRPGIAIIPGTQCPRPALRQIAPLPPVRSGIADYARTLGAYLAHRYRMSNEAALDSAVPRPSVSPGEARTLYHVGNSEHNYAAFRAARAEPGVVVLHDWSIHGMVHQCTAGAGDGEAYLALLAEAHGDRGREHGQAVLAGETSPDALAYPLCEELVRRSRGIVVHSRWMLERLSSLTGHAPVRLILHGADVFEGSVEIEQETARLGLPRGRFVVLCLGRMSRHKRVDVLLRAFQEFHRHRPDAVLVIAGEMDAAARAYVSPLLERAGLGDSLLTLGYVPAENLGPLFRAAAVSVNLRFPTFGETSGSVFRALGAGRPVIATDAGAFRELPDDCVWKVPVDHRETDLLLAYLEVLYTRPEVRSQMGANARTWIRETCLWERAAAAYASFIEDCYHSTLR